MLNTMLQIRMILTYCCLAVINFDVLWLPSISSLENLLTGCWMLLVSYYIKCKLSTKCITITFTMISIISILSFTVIVHVYEQYFVHCCTLTLLSSAWSSTRSSVSSLPWLQTVLCYVCFQVSQHSRDFACCLGYQMIFQYFFQIDLVMNKIDHSRKRWKTISIAFARI